MTKEIWKTIPGFEGLYEVSTQGRVRSLDKYVNSRWGCKRLIKGQIIKPIEHYNGYLFVSLYYQRKQIIKSVHRIVAETFISNPDNKPCIDHINTNRQDNRIVNLRWCTPKENEANELTKAKHINGNNAKKVNQLTLDGELVRVWLSGREITRELGFDNRGISDCCIGKRKTAYGFKWSFA